MSNIENLKDIIENYSEELQYLPSSEIENLQALLEDIKDKPKSIWDLDIASGKEHYVLWTDGHIDANDFISHLDEKKRDMGNAFLTREEAEFELERRKIEAIMKKHSRPFKYEEDNYHLKYFCRSGSICILNSWEFNDGLLYFESKEIARKVIDEIGIDRLKKYWFRVR